MADSTPSQIGRYNIVRQLGRGGMGVVYLARDPFIEREVALKLLRSIDDEEAHQRFMREIRIAGALSHPNVVRIYDAGIHEEQPFVAMEFVAGETMAELIRRGAALDLERKLELLIDLAEGLGYAHKRGVIHRDIKPSNLIVDEHGRLKILDFGIARLANAGRTSIGAIGTPSYMAPEQIMGEVVDARADLFSFGVVIYEVVAYRQPFVGGTQHALYNAIIGADPEPLTTIAPGTPASLATLVKTALSKTPAGRFQTAETLGEALRAVRAALTAAETQMVSRRPRTTPPPVPGPLPDSGRGSGSSPGISGKPEASKRLAELRDRQRNAAKDDARRALAEGRLADALEAAERALVLDEQDAGAQELAELARQSMDRAEAGRLLSEAAQYLAGDSLDDAQQVIDRLRRVRAGTPELSALETQLAQLRRRQERVERLKTLVEDAGRRLAERDLEGAQAALVEALDIDPGCADAVSLKANVETALRERQAERDWHGRAHQTALQARTLFDGGRVEDAMRLLEAFAPPHPETTALLVDVRARHAQAVDRQRRVAREEQRRKVRLNGLTRVQALLDARDADAALEMLVALRADGFVDDEVAALEQRAHDLRLALANERRRAAVLSRGLEAARAATARRDPDAALLALEQLTEDGFGSADIDALVSEAQDLQRQLTRARQEHLERERRNARLAAGLQEVGSALARGDVEGASVAIRFLRREGFASEELDGLERETDAMLEDAARRRQAELERERRAARIADGIAQIRAALAARDADAALAALGLLRRDGLDAAEFAALETEAQHLQQQANHERQARIAHERRQKRLAEDLDTVRRALTARDPDAALAAIGLLRRDGLDSPEFAALERDAQQLQQHMARERQEQIERERRQVKLAEGLDTVRRALAARDPDAALSAIGLLQRDGLDGHELATLDRDARQLEQQIARERQEHLERERREVHLADGLREVRAALARREPDAALAALGLLRREGFEAHDISALDSEARTLQQQIARARFEQLERERREAHLAQALGDVRAALQRRDPDAALAAVDLLRREGFDGSDVTDLEDQASDLQQQVARERYGQFERERRESHLARVLADVRAALQRREPHPALAALDLLRRDGFDVPDIATLDGEARGLQQEVARERFEHLQRERRDARLAAGVADVRAALDRRDPDAAAAAVALLRSEGFATEADGVEPEVKALLEDAARQRRAQIDREGRTSRLTRDAAAIREALERRDPDAALAVLDALRHDGLSLPDQRKLVKDARKLGDLLLREQTAAAARSAKDAVATAEPFREAAGGRPRWLVPAAIVALLVAGGGTAGWWLSRRATEPASPGTASTTPPGETAGQGSAAPASPAATAPAPGTEPPSSPAPPGEAAGTTESDAPSSGAEVLEQAARLNRRGNLRGAARLLSDLAGQTPPSAETQAANARLRDLTAEARQRAEAARRRALSANTAGTREFADGERVFDRVSRAPTRGPAFQLVAGYLDAEASFERAAGTRVSSSSTDTSPGSASATPPAQASVPAQVPAQPATVSVVPPPPGPTATGAPAPATPPSAPPAAPAAPTSAAVPDPSTDHRQIEAIVRRYFAARSRLDLAAIQSVYPGVPADRERDLMRRLESACAEFSEQPLGVDVLRVAGTTAMVQARVQTNCRPKAGKSQPPRTADIMVMLEKAGDTYRITQVNRPDQAK